ncbi:MAG: hypothetical protein V1790_16250 [Planctomycetota bacterium]
MSHRQLVILGVLGYSAIMTAPARADLFTHPSSWATYDPSANGVGNDPRAYYGGCFDGRYVYFAPSNHNPSGGGEILRYDTTCDFSTASCWSTFDVKNNSPPGAPGGYCECVFDGQRYVYFGPQFTSNGTVIRYDTDDSAGDRFTNAAAWTTYDYGSDLNGCATQQTRLGFPCVDPAGYMGLVIADGYIYFAPYTNQSGYNAEVLRYNTQGLFSDPASWQSFTPQNAAGAYNGAAYDGKYVYFVPSLLANPKVLRYDTGGNFNTAGSWEQCVPPGATQYCGAVFDARYVYFIPVKNGAVLRFDTQYSGSFCDNPGGWSVFNVTGAPLNALGGYLYGVIQADYIYFAPNWSNGSYHGEVLRYRIAGGFRDPSSWDKYDYGNSTDCAADPNCSDPDGFFGAISDGRYVYFAPMLHDSSNFSGEVLRYDMANPIPAVSQWGLVAMTLLVLTAGTLVYARRRAIHA